MKSRVFVSVFAFLLALSPPQARGDGVELLPKATILGDLNANTLGGNVTAQSAQCVVYGVTLQAVGGAATMTIGVYTGPSATGPWALTASVADADILQEPRSKQFNVARASWVKLNVDSFTSGTVKWVGECLNK